MEITGGGVYNVSTQCSLKRNLNPNMDFYFSFKYYMRIIIAAMLQNTCADFTHLHEFMSFWIPLLVIWFVSHHTVIKLGKIILPAVPNMPHLIFVQSAEF